MLRRAGKNESGIALLAVLLAMALLTAIGMAMTAVGIVEYRTSSNHRSATRALLLADGGATHALALMRGPLAGYSYTDILLGADGLPDTDDDGLLIGFDDLESDDALPSDGIELDQGRYFVKVVNDDADPSGDPYADTNNRFIALSRGVTPDGGMAEVRVMLAAPTFPAIATNGDLYLPGTPDVLGSCGGVHANGTLTIDGNPTVNGDVSSSVEVILTGTVYTPSGDIVTPRYEPPIEIPEYDPLDFCGEADFVLKDGYVITVGPPRDSAQAAGRGVLGWKWDPATNQYTLSATDAVEGTVCAHGNIKVKGNLGSDGDPFRISLLATGSIAVGGSPVIVADHPDGVLIVAGGDVTVGGNASSATPYYKGLIYAGSQCQVNGTPTVDGQILCYDAADPSGAVGLIDENKVNGTPTIRNDCTGVRRRTLVASWWESRTL